MGKINWFKGIGVMCVLGGIAVAAEIWINGAENYESASRRGGTFEWIIGVIAGLIGSKATAVFIAVLMAAVGAGLYRLGQLARR